MEKELRKSGIDPIGDVPWDTHLCLFYQTGGDLLDVLVPYFKTGLKNNEFCLWVTSEPLNEEAAEKALRKSVSNLDKYLENGQIEIIPYTEWYLKDGTLDLQGAANGWTDKLNQALARGYEGMRLTANTAWLEKKDWPDFMEYVKNRHDTIGKSKFISICTYSLNICGAPEIIDVVNSHQFALVRRGDKWDTIERYEPDRMKHALNRRVKELRCLYDVASITGTPDLTLHERFEKIVDLLPRALQYSEIAFARIDVNGSKFETENYRKTKRQMSTDIIVNGVKAGSVEVGYLKKTPEENYSLFSKEERLLLMPSPSDLGKSPNTGR